jgi:hypothetical protein
MHADSEDMQERAAGRATWPIARFRLGEEPPDDLSATTTPAQRIAMMWQLAESAWRLAGHPPPVYSRLEMPARVVRAGDRRLDTDGP